MSPSDGTPRRRSQARRLAPAMARSPVAALSSQHRTYPPNAQLQSLQQMPSSQGLAVEETTNAHAGIGEQFPAQIPLPGRRGDVLSGPMPVQFHATAVADPIEDLQGGVNSVLREGILDFGASDLEVPNEGRVAEDYRLVGDGQGPFGTSVDHPNLLDIMLSYPPTDIGGISLQDIQSLSQESLMTDPSMYENLGTSFEWNDTYSGINDNLDGSLPHHGSQQMPESVPDAEMTTHQSSKNSSSTPSLVRCGWTDCASDELYDRGDLWEHIQKSHSRSTQHTCELVCRWNSCSQKKVFTRARSFRRHIDDQHAFRKRFVCDRCGEGWGRRDKLTQHKATSKCSASQ